MVQSEPVRVLRVPGSGFPAQTTSLAARGGGTDKEKRAEARALLMKADSPETLNAALDAIENEAKAAGKAGRAALEEVRGGKAGATGGSAWTDADDRRLQELERREKANAAQ